MSVELQSLRERHLHIAVIRTLNTEPRIKHPAFAADSSISTGCAQRQSPKLQWYTAPIDEDIMERILPSPEDI